MLGARGFGALRYVVIPAALPSVVGGLKQGWAFAWRSLMAAELIALVPGHPGIGQLLNGSSTQADYIGVFEAMIAILIVGILVDSLVFGTADRAIRRRYGLIDAARDQTPQANRYARSRSSISTLRITSPTLVASATSIPSTT